MAAVSPENNLALGIWISTALSIVAALLIVYRARSKVKLKVVTYYAIEVGPSRITGVMRDGKDLEEYENDVAYFPGEHVTSEPKAVLVIRARNVGRFPVSIRAVELINRQITHIPYRGRANLGPKLPYHLEPKTTQSWSFGISQLSNFFQIPGQNKINPLSLRAQVLISDNPKKSKSSWMRHKSWFRPKKVQDPAAEGAQVKI